MKINPKNKKSKNYNLFLQELPFDIVHEDASSTEDDNSIAEVPSIEFEDHVDDLCHIRKNF